MFINYAHRGACAYAPENTMSSFHLGIDLGANGIETDVRRTKDGVLVLFHDKNLERVIGREGIPSDFTYEQLLEMKIRNEENGSEDVIVRFEDFLKAFGKMDLQFAIELKEEGLAKEVLELLDAYEMREKTVVTSSHVEYLEEVKKLAPLYRIGWLTDDFDEEKLDRMRKCEGEQLCPHSENLTAEKVRAWHEMGFSVRAWGASTPELMRHAYDCGVDGMTVNFPDLLCQYIKAKQNIS